MVQKLAVSVNTAFGLAFDIERASEKRSGYAPAGLDLGAGQKLFGDLRLDGFAALLRIGFAKRLVIVGGNEGRYSHETPAINRAEAICKMLICDFGINSERVASVASNSNTNGNIAAIAVNMEARALFCRHCAVVSSHYHLPRASYDLFVANLPIPIYPAEAFWLMERQDRKKALVKRFGGGPLAERVAEELQGIAHKLRGMYKPRTDTPAVSILSQALDKNLVA